MRFTPLTVELIRARPRLVFWLVVLAQAGLWFILPVILYTNAPGGLGTTLAVGREYALSTPSGPPLAFWLADLSFRLSGNHLFGVFLLSQACLVVAFWALFQLGRAIVDPPQAVLAVLLTITITAFSFPSAEFGPDVLALPLWSLTLLTAWRAMGQGRRRSWVGLSVSAGLLLMTSFAAPLLLGLLAAFLVTTAHGRRLLATSDPWFALLLVAVLVFPYGIVVLRTDMGLAFAFSDLINIQTAFHRSPWLIASALLALPGLMLLAISSSRWIGKASNDAPSVERPPLPGLAAPFVVYFACAPFILLSIASVLVMAPSIVGGAGLALLMSGLAVVIVAGTIIYLRRHELVRSLWLLVMAAPAAFVLFISLAQPWIVGNEVQTMLPARRIAGFFADNYQRRTGQVLHAVTGDAELATAISFAARSRPHLLLIGARGSTPWLTPQKFSETGGVIVWRATDTSGTPPEDIAQRFPGLVPEVPVTFERYVQGRQPLLRVGWALVRPTQTQTK